jgi:hypothetical protein
MPLHQPDYIFYIKYNHKRGQVAPQGTVDES